MFEQNSSRDKERNSLSPLIPNQFDLGLPISMCLPETFHFKYLFFAPPTQSLCEEE